MKRIPLLIILLVAVLTMAAQSYSPCYTESMKAGVALSVTVEDLRVVYNLLDNQGNVISTYSAE